MKHRLILCSVALAGLMSAALTSCSNDKDYGSPMEPVVLIHDLKLNVGEDLPLALGMTKKVEATITNDSVTKPELVWSSTNTNVATVGQDGTIETKALGTTTINISDRTEMRVIKKINVTVKPVATGIQLSDASIYEGSTKALVPVMTPDNAYNVFEWTSSDKNVATVDSAGNVKGVKPGTVTITAKTTDGSNLTATASVEVKEVVPVEKIELSALGFDMMVGEIEQIPNVIVPSDASADMLDWTSSNEGVVKVDANGRVTGVASGTATITAKDNLSGTTASVDVTVASQGVISANMAYLNSDSFKALGWSIGNSANYKFDGKGLVVEPTQTSGKRRADFVMYDNGHKFTFNAGTYRYFVMALTPFGAGSIKLDTSKGDFGAQPNGWLYEGTDGVKVGYWDLQKKFSAAGSEQSLFQFKMADITTEPYGYTIYWLHTFKTLEEAQAYVNSYYNK